MKWHVAPLALVALWAELASGQIAPVADHHQHLFSPAIAELLSTGGRGPTAITARDVLALLDSAGIRRALVLSVAYMYGSPARTVTDEYAKVRAENDWTGAQAAEYPDQACLPGGERPPHGDRGPPASLHLGGPPVRTRPGSHVPRAGAAAGLRRVRPDRASGRHRARLRRSTGRSGARRARGGCRAPRPADPAAVVRRDDGRGPRHLDRDEEFTAIASHIAPYLH